MTTKPETLQVVDIDHFIALLFAWHERKVKLLEHMMVIPSGTEAYVNDGETIKLDGDLLKGFKIGLSLALMELGQLPFAAETDPDTVDPTHPDMPPDVQVH
jgi:hypothetical protein